jgi:hypothetical protein
MYKKDKWAPVSGDFKNLSCNFFKVRQEVWRQKNRLWLAVAVDLC